MCVCLCVCKKDLVKAKVTKFYILPPPSPKESYRKKRGGGITRATFTLWKPLEAIIQATSKIREI